MTNNHSAPLLPPQPVRLHTIHAAIAIAAYSAVQTGPNSQLGGFHAGFLRVADHVGISGVVASAPRPATEKHLSRKTIKPIQSPLLDTLRLCILSPLALSF